MRLTGLRFSVLLAVLFLFASGAKADTGARFHEVAGISPGLFWETVPANIASDVSNKSCSVKIGEPILFEEYGVLEQIDQAFKIIFNPIKANQQRVLSVVPIDEISLTDWRRVRSEFRDSPPDHFAILSGVPDGEDRAFVGVPIKWEDGIAESMEVVWTLSESSRAPDIKIDPLDSQAIEIFRLSALISGGGDWSSDRRKNSINSSYKVRVSEAIPHIVSSSVDDMNKFLAFSRLPEILKRKSNQKKVISDDGYVKKIKGYGKFIWPRDLNNLPGPPGCVD